MANDTLDDYTFAARDKRGRTLSEEYGRYPDGPDWPIAVCAHARDLLRRTGAHSVSVWQTVSGERDGLVVDIYDDPPSMVE